MRKTSIKLILLTMAQLIFCTKLPAASVQVFALEAMPFCGIIDGKPAGIAIDTLNRATEYGAPEFRFSFDLPWPRATKRVQFAEDELIAIIPFTRSATREDKFRWIAEIMATEYRFYSHTRQNPIKSIEEIQGEEIGVVHGHAIIAMLESMGFKLDTGAKTAEKNAIKMTKERVKIIADSDVISIYSWKKIGQDVAELQEGPAIGEIKRVYIASSLNFPADIAKSIYNAIEKMRQSGELQKIYNKWL